ncbi:MAG: oxidoreductase [Myxococcales bacterium]|nr:oxidoreductase [Myxococcales bacterium]
MNEVRYPTAQSQAVWGHRRAGGTDVMDRLRHGRIAGPLVDLRDVPGLEGLVALPDGSVEVGAKVTLARLATDARVRAAWPGLADAAGGLATPQIRQVATVGGSLLQRTRCAWFRSPDFRCHKSGGAGCPALAADHHWNSIFGGGGPCVAPHPSTLAVALLAFDALVLADGRGALTVPELYGDGQAPDREHTLTDEQFVVGIRLPAPLPGATSGWFRTASRARAEWPLVEAVIRVVPGGMRVAVGGVAPVPMRLPAVEAALEAGEGVAASAKASAGAHTNPGSAYKAALLQATIETLLERLFAPRGSAP